MTKEIDIPKGYKKTKVGVIPKEWEVKRINQFASLASGGTPNREISEYWNGDIPWITTTLINGKIIHSSEEYISTDGLNNSSAKIFSKETILMAMYGQGQTRGRVSKLGIEAATNQACAAITPDSSVNTDFLIEFLSLNYANIRKLSNTGNQKNLNLQLIKTIPVKVPPLPEQQKIASILTTWDKAIEHVQLVIDNLKVRNKGLAQQLLTGKKRLKGFEGEWRKEKLGKLLKEVKSKPVKCPEQYELISIKLYGKGIISTGKFPKNTKKGRSYHFRNEGEIIIGRQNFHNGSIAFMPKFKNKMIASNAISSFSSVNGIDDCWIINYLLRPSFYLWVENLIGGTGQKEINRKDFNNIPIVVPPFKEQQAIAKVLTNADQELKLYEKKLVTLQEQKKGLMQKLLTGEIRVKTEKL